MRIMISNGVKKTTHYIILSNYMKSKYWNSFHWW